MKTYQKTITVEAGEGEFGAIRDEVEAAAQDGFVLDKIVRQDKYVFLYFVEAK